MKRHALRPTSLALLLAIVVGAPSLLHAGPRTRETPVVRAVDRVVSSVVNIHSEKTQSVEDSLFGGTEGPRSRKVNGMGTGVVIDERGYIVTNHHVVDGVDSLRVTLLDGSTYMARIVTTDPTHDLAVIKIESSTPLDVMPLGTSSDLMLGESVIAVGNAFGYKHSVTIGIVSAIGRDVEVNEHQRYVNLVQTDASINPGNSGGPLVNLEGDVIGINVAIRAGAQRIGFAIPIDDVRRTVAKMIRSDRIGNTMHGVRTREVKEPNSFTLFAEDALPDSPADKCGIQKGDVIRRVGKIDVADAVDVERAMLGRKAGESVEVEVDRAGESHTLELVVAAAPSRAVPEHVPAVVRANNDPRPVASQADRTWDVLGVKLERIGPAEREIVGPRYRGGLRVLRVRPNSPAARNGIRRGDLLVGLHIWETINPDNVEYVLDHPQFTTFNPIKFYIVRGRETLFGHLRIASK